MKKILIIDTGGTFNKIYSPRDGNLDIDTDSNALKDIANKWLCELRFISIIGKDSLDMDNKDRLLLLESINQSNHEHIIIIHGTDTIDITAKYLLDKNIEKQIMLTAAMVPYSIDPVEATANLASALGYMQAKEKKGIYIAMNGVFGLAEQIKKNRKLGKFLFTYKGLDH